MESTSSSAAGETVSRKVQGACSPAHHTNLELTPQQPNEAEGDSLLLVNTRGEALVKIAGSSLLETKFESRSSWNTYDITAHHTNALQLSTGDRTDHTTHGGEGGRALCWTCDNQHGEVRCQVVDHRSILFLSASRVRGCRPVEKLSCTASSC